MSQFGVTNLHRKALSSFHRLKVIDLDCFAIGRNSLHHLGPWPLPEERPIKLLSVWRTFQAYNSFGIATYNAIIGLPAMAYVSIGKDFSVTIESLASVFIAALVASCYFGIICRSDQLERMVQARGETMACSLKMSLRPESILSSNRRQITTLARLLIVFLVVMPSVLLTLPKAIQERTLVNKVWYPFDAYVYPIYPVMLFVTSLAHIEGMAVSAANLMILMAMLAEVAGHFRLLSYNLRNICADNREELGVGESERAREELKTCVQHHLAIIRFMEEIKSTYNVDLFLVGLSVLVPNGLGIALVAFSEEIDSKLVTFVIVIVFGNAVVLGLFWAAQDVADESEAVRQAVYDGGWFDQTESFKRNMRLIMTRCSQPVVLKAGGLIKFSMETYYDLIKLTYSYCMALWTTLQANS